ncbi:MAG: hypothetical protein LBP27_02245 [Treponema sp.]|jgi:hypothetical protein|nr:hypothetical protein [Treponema sp.]
MKKKLLCGIVGALAVLCVLFFAGCPTEAEDDEKKGTTWTSEGGIVFKWYEDNTFETRIPKSVSKLNADATVTGKLKPVNVDADTGTGTYAMTDLSSGNSTINAMLPTMMEGKELTITKNESEGTLKIESTIAPPAGTFLNGNYTKK